MPSENHPTTWQPARLIQAQETEILSCHTCRRYRIQTASVGTPPPQGYPVLYILDGDAFFPAVLSMAQSLLVNPMTQSHAPCLLVGIGYPNGEIRDLIQRASDYTPPLPDNADENEQQKFGHADRFGQFIDEELKSLLAAEYPLNPDEQALFGHSFGALFGTYSLFTAPQRFNRYFLASPSLWWHNRRVLDFIPSKIKAAGVQIAVGGLEQKHDHKRRSERAMITEAEKLADILSAHHIPNRFKLYPDTDHGSTPFYALPDIIAVLQTAWQNK